MIGVYSGVSAMSQADQSPTTSTEPSTSTNVFNDITISKRKTSIQCCAFCGESSATNPLIRFETCIFCGTAAYCSIEHQKFDWKRHAMLCKAMQARNYLESPENPTNRSRRKSPVFSLQNSSDEPDVEDQPMLSTFSGGSSAFRPYNKNTFGAVSSGAVSSLTASLHVTSFSQNQPEETVISTETGAKLIVPVRVLQKTLEDQNNAEMSKQDEGLDEEEERIVPTDDPDIQIIEGGSSKTTTQNAARARKRPTPSNSAELRPMYKDHNKNLVYSTTLQEHQKHLQNRGLSLNLHQAMVLRLRYIAEHVIRSLNEFGWAVVDNFLGADHYKYTALEIERLYERGLFSAGQLMEGKNKDECHIKDIRSDQIYWYDGADSRACDAATVRLLISMIDSVIQHFKKRIDHEIGGRSRAMLAIYPGSGTRYVKHVDNPVKDGRCITTIYYCNENWDMVKDGGTLRLYPETSLTPMDIDPRADRLVFFWSDRRNPHEVMPVYRHRYAITIWYMDKNEREKALAKSKESESTSKKEDQSTPTVSLSQPPRKNPSSHDLASMDLRVFPSTSSDPTLSRDSNSIEKELERNLSDVRAESIDSGVSSTNLDRCGSFQSMSSSFRTIRNNHNNVSRKSSASSEDSNLPPPRTDNLDYVI